MARRPLTRVAQRRQPMHSRIERGTNNEAIVPTANRQPVRCPVGVSKQQD